MCGITGWVSYGSDLIREQATIAAMTATMACRGPDDSGTWVRPHVALGHSRLAIIDLVGGVQPMTVQTPNGSVALVYSGEAYNFLELRDDLTSRGHRFKTDSDTEVVLRGYLEWGDAVAERINGMYAFAIWDERERRLVLVRDRMGIKPLYYYRTADGLMFGSEPKAILANPLAKKIVDANGMRELIAFTKAPGWSLWKDMYEVEPGTVVSVDTAGVRTRTYWRLPAIPHTDDQNTTVETVRELMSDIVKRQLVADVPRCVLLSGGLDSSVITGLAAAQLAEEGEQLRTFSVDFRGHDENFKPYKGHGTRDAPYVRDVVDRVGSAHHDVVLNAADHADPAVRRAVITARDIPAGLGDVDPSLYLLFKAVREESTVALSGESADEVFGGYHWFDDENARNTSTFPWLALKGLITDRAPLLSAEARAHLDVDRYVADQYATAVASVEHVNGETAVDSRMRTIYTLFLTRWLRALLDRKDRVSMAVGLEVRVPFCDHRLVEYVYNTPWSLKTFDGREKSLLRQACAHVLPQSVAERVKSGYPSTQETGYGAALQQQAKEVLAEPDNPLFAIVDRTWLEEAVQVDPANMRKRVRLGIDWVLDLCHWLEIYSPQLIM